MELQQQQIEEMEKNSILRTIMSRNPDEFSSTFAMSQLLLYNMQNTKK